MNQPDFVDENSPPTRIKVVGVGGGGSNAVDSMIDLGLTGVDFCNINTDLQALNLSHCPHRLQIGAEITGGRGCGGDPAMGEKAAQASKEEIAELLQGCEMVFIAAGLGGGTGTGASPVVAEIAKSMGLLTVAIVTKPFAFEGPQRLKRAEQGLARLSKFVDTKIVILNDKLMEVIGPKTQLTEAFRVANEVLARGVQAISDLISVPGVINVDFADVRSIMGETGGAVMGVGSGKGENRASEAVKKACSSPLLEKIEIHGAQGVLISITASSDVSLEEIGKASEAVYEMADGDANIIFGLVINPELKDEMRVTIIATGFDDGPQRQGDDEVQQAPAPRSEMDLSAKVRSMMAGTGKQEPAPPASQPQQEMHLENVPAPRTPQPNPRPVPQQATPSEEPEEWAQAPLPPREPEPAPAPQPEHRSAAPQPPDKEPDDDTPAYLRRRKRHLFE